MHSLKKATILVSMLLAVIILGIGAASVSLHGRHMQEAAVIVIHDEQIAYGPSAEVIAPIAGQALATTPVIGYDGAITVRFYSANGNAHKLKVSANGRTGSLTLPADNSTVRFPLIYGVGEYTITVMEMLDAVNARQVAYQKLQAGGAVVPAASSGGVSAGAPGASTGTAQSGWVIDTTDPYLTPVADIDWADDLASVKKARELCETLSTEKDKAKAVYDYLVGRLTYDYEKVGRLPSGYTPNMDTTYATGKGICYDFSSLYAGMMRSVGVKCKMVKGYNDKIEGYHAWNDVYYDGAWHRIDLTIDCQLYKSGAHSFSSPKGSVTTLSSY